jgi:sugar/nucleoside kinase (ribokinase family)
MSRLISVGNIIVDVVLRVPELPERGGDVLAASDGMTPGGSFNTLVTATRQGLASAYAGGHGTGPFGDLVRGALSAEGIALLSPRHPDQDTGFDIAMVDAEGERTFVTAFGAEARLADLPMPEVGDFVHVSRYGVLDATNADVIVPWLDTVGAGVTVLFDPGPLVRDIRPAVMDAVRARADWLSCNRREAELLGSLAAWKHRIVRLGAEGCTVDGEHVPGFAVDAIDTNGAGDAHVGTFLAGLADGIPPLAAARRANAAAALSTTSRGPASSPTFAETAELAP